MHYFSWRRTIDDIMRNLRSAGVKSNAPRNVRIAAMLQASAQENFVIFASLVMDLIHENTGCLNVFVEDEKLVEFLEEANFDVDPDEFSPPAQAFTLSVPESLASGVGASIICCTNQGEMPGLVMAAFDSIGYRYPKNMAKSIEEWGTGMEGQALMIATKIKGKEKSEILLSHFPLRQIRNCATPTLGLDWYKSLPSFEAGSAQMQGEFVVPLRDEDINIQLRAVQLAIRLCWFMRAFPNCCKEGIPDKASIEGSQGRPEHRNVRIFLPDKIRNSPSSHVRGYHFRTLRAERFHRDEHGRTRVVFVRSSLVAPKGRNITVESPRTPRTVP